ncbi:metallophosphoesterase [Pontibacter harenae]|uniref:metallophosphoesterase n=1 Tax=Pontibacter harenae TaxID=2894083 RepID=UPI001E64894D|nr:metallophosphoesterase [Pontibacter harenae]MCC9167119.1 metallophosphoesterase [Pontibacter harenae]
MAPADQKFNNLILPDLHGPFHIIGDVHGCFQELHALLHLLDFKVEYNEIEQRFQAKLPQHQKLIFVGDLVDRGPDSPAVLQLVMDLVEQGLAFCVLGNHDDKLYRKLKGRKVKVRHGLEVTMEQLQDRNKAFIDRVRNFIGKLPHHLVLDDDRLVVAHAGLEERLHKKNTRAARELSLYGPTTGQLDQNGFPVRLDWAADYAGEAVVVYGHTPVYEPRWRNNTINIDTGCVFGGRLTALSYPDFRLTAVDAFKLYTEPARPFVKYAKAS